MAMEAADWVARRTDEDGFDAAGFDAWVAGDARRGPLFDTMWRQIMQPGMGAALSAYTPPRRSPKAAMVGGALSVAVLFAGFQLWPSAELYLASPQVYAASEGAMRQVQLEDGTALTLAGGADIAVRFTGHDRELVLKRGTIFAHVARDPERPFRIIAGDGQVTVLGTRFEVAMKPSAVRVAVEQGHVRFARNGWFGETVDLTAAQSASLTPDMLTRELGATADGAARWRNGWAEYDNAPLRQVVSDLESLSPVPIRMVDERLGKRRVSGRIRLTDPLRQIENLSLVHSFTVTQTDDAIELSEN